MSDGTPRGVDISALKTYLTSVGVKYADDAEVSLIAGGKSNLTYVLRCGPDDYVLRRPPLGHVLATAHDMSREYRVMQALGQTSVPVPAMVTFCEDPNVLGAPFYVMEKVEGTSFRWRHDLESKDSKWVAAVSGEMMGTLADLHTVVPSTVGLEEFGKSQGYLGRQVRTWTRQLDSSRSRDVPGIDDLRSAVAARIPSEGQAAIVHGDFRLDNLLVTDDGKVRAIVDWEMATLGDPWADLALTLAYVELARRQRGAGISDGIADASTVDGFLSDEELVETYAESAGRDVAISDLSWHLGLAFFKLAVILEGIYLRHQQGQTVGDGFDSAGDLVGLAVDAGLTSMKVGK